MSTCRFAALFFLAVFLHAEAAVSPVREVNLRLYDLIYDHVGDHLYATSPDHPGHLLQLDPQSGEITATFPVGSVPYRLVLDHRRGLWIGLSGESDVVRFNLETLVAEPKFELGVPPNTHVLDIAPSPADPDTFAVVAGRVYLVRDGQVLPDSLPAPFNTQSIVMLGNYIFSDTFRARMTPSGLVADGSRLYSEIKVADGKLYLESGAIVDPLSGQNLGQFDIPMSGERFGFAINAVDNSIFFLSYSTHYILSRFDRTSRELTGFYPFQYYPGPAWTTHLVPIGTNTAAFHTDEKLIFVDLTPAFARGELSVSASIESDPVHFGQLITQSITVTNAGPGYVFDAVLTNILAGDVRYPEIPAGASVPWNEPPYNYPWGRDEYHFELGAMPPGTAQTFRFRLLPLSAGAYTNLITLAAQYESDTSNNSLTLPVEVVNPFTNTFARLAPFGPNISDFGYDAPTDQLILGTTNGHLGFVDLDAGTMNVTRTGGHPIEHISIASDTRTAWVNIWGWSSLHRVPIDDPALGPERRLGALVRDLAASPVDPNVAAYSTDSRVHLVDYINFIQWPLTNYADGSGIVRFSEDGQTLYQVLDFDCSLRLFNVSTGALTLQRTFPNVGCFGFFEADGLLYFDNGHVFDPATGATVTNLNLSYPSFVVLDPAGPLNILTQVNGDWLVRQLDRTTFAEITRFNVGRRGYSPTAAISAGPSRIAFRNPPGEVVLVRFGADPSVLRLEAINTASGILLQFATAESARYQLETSPTIATPAWTPLGEIIPGTGQNLQRPIPLTAPSHFFRLIRLP